MVQRSEKKRNFTQIFQYETVVRYNSDSHHVLRREEHQFYAYNKGSLTKLILRVLSATVQIIAEVPALDYDTVK